VSTVVALVMAAAVVVVIVIVVVVAHVGVPSNLQWLADEAGLLAAGRRTQLVTPSSFAFSTSSRSS
jgi:hypothetical protein